MKVSTKAASEKATQWFNIRLFNGKPTLGITINQKFIDELQAKMDEGHDFAVLSRRLTVGAKKNEYILSTVSFPDKQDATKEVEGTNFFYFFGKKK